MFERVKTQIQANRLEPRARRKAWAKTKIVLVSRHEESKGGTRHIRRSKGGESARELWLSSIQ